jgi:hypothetical protein
VILAMFVASRRRLAYNPFLLWAMYPVSATLFVCAVWNSALATLRRGGVVWRDTFYPLPDLRAGVVRRGAGRRFLVTFQGGPAGGRRPPP